MNEEEIDQLKSLLRKYFKTEIEIWESLSEAAIKADVDDPRCVFASELNSLGKFHDGTEQLKQLWMDEILYCLMTDGDRGKYERG